MAGKKSKPTDIQEPLGPSARSRLQAADSFLRIAQDCYTVASLGWFLELYKKAHLKGRGFAICGLDRLVSDTEKHIKEQLSDLLPGDPSDFEVPEFLSLPEDNQPIKKIFVYDPKEAINLRTRMGLTPTMLVKKLGFEGKNLKYGRNILYKLESGKARPGNHPRGEFVKAYADWLVAMGYKPSMPASDPREYEGDKARKIRIQKKLTVSRLANQLGIGESANSMIAAYETGRISPGYPPRGRITLAYLGWLKEMGYDPYCLGEIKGKPRR